MKGFVRIGGALLGGALIVAGAILVRGQSDGEAEPVGPVVTVAPERQHIDATDSDNDGTPDWEEMLTTRVFDSIPTPTSTSDMRVATYTPPTTFTGQFAEAFLKDYMEGKVQTGSVDTTALVNNAVTAIESKTASKHYTRNDITIVPTTADSLRAYGNRIMEIVQTRSIKNEFEVDILQRALETNDPKVLDDLKPISEVYKNVIADTLLVETPDVLAGDQVLLLDAYQAVYTDIEAMRIVFDDPLYALARIKRYKEDLKGIYNAYLDISKTIRAGNVEFGKEEPGSAFYMFDV